MLKMDSEAIPNDRMARRRAALPPARTQASDRRVIRLKERSLAMLKQDLILRNPLRLLGYDSDDILEPGQFGAVLARAGVGKTALVIQIALNTMLRSKKVLHISLNEPVGKVNLWYKEVLGRLAQQYQVPQLDRLWDTIVGHRFIMTFQVEGFSAPKLEERLTDLTSQGIFTPHLVIIDGQPFDPEARTALDDLKALAIKLKLPFWFTINTHRHEAPAPDGLPIQLSSVQALFDVAVALQPVENAVHIKPLKGCRLSDNQPPLVLDPATMLIQGQS
jgi:hypothetical protein